MSICNHCHRPITQAPSMSGRPLRDYDRNYCYAALTKQLPYYKLRQTVICLTIALEQTQTALRAALTNCEYWRGRSGDSFKPYAPFTAPASAVEQSAMSDTRCPLCDKRYAELNDLVLADADKRAVRQLYCWNNLSGKCGPDQARELFYAEQRKKLEAVSFAPNKDDNR